MADYADYGVDITQMGYNKFVKGADPDWIQVASLGLTAASDYAANVRGGKARASDLGFTSPNPALTSESLRDWMAPRFVSKTWKCPK